jgi:uncharacterized protein (TIRG00374 family)
MTTVTGQKLRNAEIVVVGSVLAFIMIGVIASLVVGVDGILRNIARVDPVVIGGLLGLSLVNYGARTFRWHQFSRYLKLEVPLSRTALYYFAGFSMTTTPAKLGEALRCWLIERCHRYGYHRVAPLFIGDRLSDVSALGILCVVGLTAFSHYRWTALLIVAGFAVFTILFVWPRWLISIVGATYEFSGRRRPRLFAQARRALRLTASLFSWRVLVTTLLLGISGWLAECLAFYWLLHQLGTSVSLLQATFIFSFAMVAGAITMLPGGLGGAEVAMLTLLALVGVGFDTAVVATAIIRLTSLWFAVGLGFMALPFAMRLARRCQIEPHAMISVVK